MCQAWLGRATPHLVERSMEMVYIYAALASSPASMAPVYTVQWPSAPRNFRCQSACFRCDAIHKSSRWRRSVSDVSYVSQNPVSSSITQLCCQWTRHSSSEQPGLDWFTSAPALAQWVKISWTTTSTMSRSPCRRSTSATCLSGRILLNSSRWTTNLAARSRWSELLPYPVSDGSESSSEGIFSPRAALNIVL